MADCTKDMNMSNEIGTELEIPDRQIYNYSDISQLFIDSRQLPS